jgi:prepilin-type N-terminal cleavage/methylation domain-containing protein
MVRHCVTPTCAKQAFSLVELSIVLVILGLLVGGILSGQSLIRAAELRSVSTDLNGYATSLHMFRDKYFNLPGDMTNATSFWLTDPDGCPSHTVRTPRTTTCNGNGDGIIGDVAFHEYFRAWQHLANAGLIEGSYTGVSGPSGGRHAIIGQNVPRARLSNTGFSFYYEIVVSNHGARFVASSGQVLEFGREGGAADPAACAPGNETCDGGIKPEEAWNIDSKTDDGLPGTGKILTWWSCATTNDPATAAYPLSVTTDTCNLQYSLLRR